MKNDRRIARWSTSPAWIFLIGIAAAAFLPSLAAPADLPTPERWEQAIKKFEAEDKETPPPKNAVLFLGSSSIVFWKLTESFPDLTLIKRGFGGSFIRESTYYADRIVIPYEPKAIVLYAGDNDIAAGMTAEEVFADYKAFVAKVHAALPDTVIVFLSIKPSIARWSMVEEQRKANRLIEDFSKSEPRLRYVDVATVMLGDDGKPRADLLLQDGLHLNDEGYKRWTEILAPVVAQLASSPASSRNNERKTE